MRDSAIPKRIRKGRQPQKSVVGIAWYTPEEWERLRDGDDKPEDLNDTYEEWLESASHVEQLMSAQEHQAVRVPIVIDDLIAWCTVHDLPVGSRARSRYVAEKVSEQYAGQPADN